jgi:hypothetical protein
MYFVNENTEAVTKRDQGLLFEVCILLKTFCLVCSRKFQENPNWKARISECHTIARLVSIPIKDLSVVDGFLIGLRINLETSSAEVVKTDHSWLTTPDGAIIDPYPMGIITSTSALLIPTKNTRYVVHGSNLYNEDRRVQENFDLTKSWKDARSLFRLLKRNAREEDMMKACSELF